MIGKQEVPSAELSPSHVTEWQGVMTSTVPVTSKLPDVGVSIFAVMTRLANEHGASTCRRGFRTSIAIPRWSTPSPRRCATGTTSTRRCRACWRCARRSPPRWSSCYGADVRPGHRSRGHLRRDRGSLRDADRVRAAGRRGRAVRAVLRLVRAGDSTERRHAGVRQPALSGLLAWTGTRCGARSRRGRARFSSTRRTTRPGATWSADDMRQLAAIVDGTDIILIGDEVYEHIIFDGRRHESLLRYPDLRARACVISSFGKTFHTTGWKVGYCVGAAAADRRSEARAPVHDVHRAHAVADRVCRVRAAAIRSRRTSRRSISRSAICSCS